MMRKAHTVGMVLFVGAILGLNACAVIGGSRKDGARFTTISHQITEEAKEICEFGSVGVEGELEAVRAKREQLNSIEPNIRTTAQQGILRALDEYTEDLETLRSRYGHSCVSYRRCQIQSSRLEGVSCEKERENYDNTRGALNTVHTELLIIGGPDE